MSSSGDFGRKILMNRMIAGLERAGYRVEFAEEYHGWIVAGQGEDPAVMLLEADAIEKIRRSSPGSAQEFVGRIVSHVRGQISAQGSSSLQPPPSKAARDYSDVSAAPPTPVGGEVMDDMIVGEDGTRTASAPPPLPGGRAGRDLEDGEGTSPGSEDVSLNMDDPEAFMEGVDETGGHAHDAPADPDTEKDRLESEVTEELSLEDFK